MNESRCSQPERDTGRNVKWLQSYFLGNGSQYEEPTVSSIYMGWMADWVQVEEWDLAARQGTPLSSTAVLFHYNTPLKPPAHNRTYGLIEGGGGGFATIYKYNRRCKSLTIWFMLMWLSLFSLNSVFQLCVVPRRCHRWRDHVSFANVEINEFVMSSGVSIFHWQDP